MTHAFYTPEDVEYLDDTVPYAARELHNAEELDTSPYDVAEHLDRLDAIDAAIQMHEDGLRVGHCG